MIKNKACTLLLYSALKKIIINYLETNITVLLEQSLVNVGGIKLTPIEIEHSIMQHPSKVNNLQTGNLNREQEILVKNSYGLEKEEPNIIFALCCGTKSSPAVSTSTFFFFSLNLTVQDLNLT